MLVRVYICQNEKLLEISCTGPYWNTMAVNWNDKSVSETNMSNSAN